EAAKTELALAQPEQFKIFILAVMAGMRRNEIDKALWSWVDWGAGCIRITPTKDFRTKSDDAVRSVWLPPEVLEILRGYRARATGVFILESKVKARPEKLYDHYRAGTQFEKLIGWLRSKGVNGKKPVHTLRKEFGSLIAQKFGIYAAKEVLGHADIATTASHYLEAKERPMIGLGHLLPIPAVSSLVSVSGEEAAPARKLV